MLCNPDGPAEEIRARLKLIELLPENEARLLKNVLRVLPVQQQRLERGQDLR